MATPILVRTASAVSSTTNSTSWTPSWTWGTNTGLNSGDTVLWQIIVTSDGANITLSETGGNGWTKKVNGSDGAQVSQAIFIKETTAAYASSVAPSFVLGSSGSEQFSAVLLTHYIGNSTNGKTAGFEISSAATGSSTNSNPPAVTNSRGARIEAAVVTTRGGDSTVVATAVPSGYSNHVSRAGGGTAGASTNTATKDVTINNSSTEDPGTWTSASEQWISYTYAVYEVLPTAAGWTPVLVGSIDRTTPSQSFTRTGVDGWTNGAYSLETFSGDVQVEALIPTSSANILIGLDDQERLSDHYNCLYAAYWEGVGNNLKGRHSGSAVGSNSPGGHTSSSVMGIRRTGTNVEIYYRDSGGSDTIIHTVTGASSSALRVLIAINPAAGTLSTVTAVAPQTLTVGLSTNSQTFYGPTVVRGAVTLTPSLYTGTQTFHSPTVTQIMPLSPSLVTNSATFFSPTITQAGETLSPSLFTNTTTFYDATVVRGTVTVTPSLVTNTQTFYTPTVVRGQVNLTSTLINSTTTFFPPTILQASTQTLSPSLMASTVTFFSPSIVTTQSMTVELFTNEPTFFSAFIRRPTMVYIPRQDGTVM
jgi:hypothetical protein